MFLNKSFEWLNGYLTFRSWTNQCFWMNCVFLHWKTMQKQCDALCIHYSALGLLFVQTISKNKTNCNVNVMYHIVYLAGLSLNWSQYLLVTVSAFLTFEPSLNKHLYKEQPVQQRAAFFEDVVVIDSEAWTNEMQMGAGTLAVVQWFCL